MDQQKLNDDNINISDVIEVIETQNPEFMESSNRKTKDSSNMSIDYNRPGWPYIDIVEQPASKALRFRYECEGRSAGSIPGVNSTPENKTFPTIRVVGHKGRSIVVVSCVTKDPPYRPHPHNLVGKEGCKQGVCTVQINRHTMTHTFSNLGIQCVKRKDIEDALKTRECIRVDPFRTGFSHKKNPSSIDLNAVRLCFQGFMEGSTKGKFNLPMRPVVSDIIFDKKAMSDLVICKLSHCCAPVAGGMEMILLCEKVSKDDIQIRFFEVMGGQVIWEGYGDFQPMNVHKQTAIAFRTPTYRLQEIEHPADVFIQLKRPSDGITSEALPFQMLPLGTEDPDHLRRKRQKSTNSPDVVVINHIQKEENRRQAEKKKPQKQRETIRAVRTGVTERPESALSRSSSHASANVKDFKSSPSKIDIGSPSYLPNLSMLRSVESPLNDLKHMPRQDYNPYLPAQESELSSEYHQISNQALPSLSVMQQGYNFQHQDESSREYKPFTGSEYSQPRTDTTQPQPGPSLLDMDNQQLISFDPNLNELDSGELAVLGTDLADNLNSGLSLKEDIDIDIDDVVSTNINEPNNVEGRAEPPTYAVAAASLEAQRAVEHAQVQATQKHIPSGHTPMPSPFLKHSPRIMTANTPMPSPFIKQAPQLITDHTPLPSPFIKQSSRVASGYTPMPSPHIKQTPQVTTGHTPMPSPFLKQTSQVTSGHTPMPSPHIKQTPQVTTSHTPMPSPYIKPSLHAPPAHTSAPTSHTKQSPPPYPKKLSLFTFSRKSTSPTKQNKRPLSAYHETSNTPAPFSYSPMPPQYTEVPSSSSDSTKKYYYPPRVSYIMRPPVEESTGDEESSTPVPHPRVKAVAHRRKKRAAPQPQAASVPAPSEPVAKVSSSAEKKIVSPDPNEMNSGELADYEAGLLDDLESSLSMYDKKLDVDMTTDTNYDAKKKKSNKLKSTKRSLNKEATKQPQPGPSDGQSVDAQQQPTSPAQSSPSPPESDEGGNPIPLEPRIIIRDNVLAQNYTSSMSTMSDREIASFDPELDEIGKEDRADFGSDNVDDLSDRRSIYEEDIEMDDDARSATSITFPKSCSATDSLGRLTDCAMQKLSNFHKMLKKSPKRKK